MRLNSSGASARLLLAMLALSASAAAGAAPSPAATRQSNHHQAASSKSSAADAAPSSAPRAAIASVSADDLHKLMDNHHLTELRTSYNSTYGASLLFDSEALSYYVAIFHDNKFLRIVQTDAIGEAESFYRGFVAQTEKLGQVDIDKLRLEAGNKYTAHLVQLNEQRLQNLQQDVARQRDQARQVVAQQQQTQQQAISLTSDLRASSNQLDSVKQRIQQLEDQQTSPELALPPPEPAQPAAAPAPAPSSSSP